MKIDRLDHLVLTVRNLAEMREFYTLLFGMEAVVFDEGRVALCFGQQQINLTAIGAATEIEALHPAPGLSPPRLRKRHPGGAL
jgi:catechol 2,3-dioxygenase-like lactoylglutathione lyase family enzyme